MFDSFLAEEEISGLIRDRQTFEDIGPLAGEPFGGEVFREKIEGLNLRARRPAALWTVVPEPAGVSITILPANSDRCSMI